jgi:hypothetical protein
MIVVTRSYKNTLIGETLIKELESQGALMDEQKKAFLDKLHAEENALKEEIDKNMVNRHRVGFNLLS